MSTVSCVKDFLKLRVDVDILETCIEKGERPLSFIDSVDFDLNKLKDSCKIDASIIRQYENVFLREIKRYLEENDIERALSKINALKYAIMNYLPDKIEL